MSDIHSPPSGYATWLDWAASFSLDTSAELAQLRQRLADTEALFATARANLAALEEQRAQAVRERDEKEIERNEVLDTLAGAARDLRNAQEERDALRAQLAELTESICCGHQATAAEAMRALAEHFKDLAETESELEKAQAQLAELRGGPPAAGGEAEKP